MKTVVWDVDDVLNDLMKAWFAHWVSKQGGVFHLTFDELTVNPPHELLGIGRSEYLASLDDFRLSGGAAKLQPLSEVFAWFRQNGDSCRNIALTATPLRAAPASAEWVMRNFGRWIRSYNLVPSPRETEDAGAGHATKSDFLRWWGKADILVDDNEENVAGALSAGIQAVLFPRPWNSSKLSVAEALASLTELIGAESKRAGE